jgi:uncharacterized membrane protein YoaK (UPF0700 family)
MSSEARRDTGHADARVASRRAAIHGLHRAVIDERDGPLPGMLVALTVLAGVVDAASILALGGVFVATVTGNIVFIGLGIAGARQFAVVTCLLAIGGFIVGALVGGRACRIGRQHRGRVTRDVLHVKVLLASVVTVIAVVSGDNLDRPLRDAVVVLLAMSMGAQLALIRYLKVPDLMTVVLTLTITGALTERGLGWSHPAMLRRFAAVIAFAVGAISGGVLVLYVSVGAALALGLAIIVGVTVAAHLAASSTADWTAPH